MRTLLLLFVLISTIVVGQENPKQFGSEIMTYHQIGYAINKQPNMIIVDSKGVEIEDRDSCYQIQYDYGDEHSVTTAYIINGDTLLPQQYNYKFIALPFPKVRWTAMERFAIRDPYRPETYEDIVIGLHRDSLSYLKDFEIHHYVPNVPELKWEVVQGELIASGMHSTVRFDGGYSLPDAFIDSLKLLKDTIYITMQLTIRSEGGPSMKKSASIELIKLDGLAYELQRDPYYLFNLYSDTIEITKEQLLSTDSLVINNTGRIYLKLPRLKKDYYFKWYSEYGFCYDIPYTKVEAGKGFVIVNAGGNEGEELLQLTYEEDRYKKIYDPKTGKEIDRHFNKMRLFFTYPER